MFPLIVLVATAVATAQGACLGGCYIPTSHYQEVGCKAVYTLPSCCPAYYDCSKFFEQEADKCYYKGNVYKHREEIPTNLTAMHCATGCFCSKGERPEDVTCAQLECPEIFDPPQLGDCFLAYELDGCCSSKTVCPPFDKVATCDVNGTLYYEGQKFRAPGKERELKCVCKANFEGKFEEPFCRKISCGTELRNTAHFRNKCAPIYNKTRLTCPIRWECPRKGDTIIPNIHGSTSAKKCYYGEQQLNVGDQLRLKRSVHSPAIKCECRIPPLVTCSQV